MKATVKFVLVIFIFFLSAPTILSLIEKETATDTFFAFSEEELVHKDFKLVKMDISSGDTVDTSFLYTTPIKIFSKIIPQLKNPPLYIFSPPPNV